MKLYLSLDLDIISSLILILNQSCFIHIIEFTFLCIKRKLTNYNYIYSRYHSGIIQLHPITTISNDIKQQQLDKRYRIYL